MTMGQYTVYIMASASGVLYVGVTNDIARRVSEHKLGMAPGFTKRYKCHRLVWYESGPDVSGAIISEKKIKGWRRSKKDALIAAMNPAWRDLSEDFGK